MVDDPKIEMPVENALDCDYSDEALERAAAVNGQRVFTIAFCTQDWNYCYPL